MLDGVSLLPLFQGRHAAGTRVVLALPALRQSRWRTCGGHPARRLETDRVVRESPVELFNLADDLGEQHDLYRQNPERADRLRAELRAWQKEVGAKLPTVNPKYEPTYPSGRAAERTPAP